MLGVGILARWSEWKEGRERRGVGDGGDGGWRGEGGGDGRTDGWSTGHLGGGVCVFDWLESSGALTVFVVGLWV